MEYRQRRLNSSTPLKKKKDWKLQVSGQEWKTMLTRPECQIWNNMLEFGSWNTWGKKKLQTTAQFISHFIFKTLYWPNSFLNHTEGRNYPINYCSAKEVSSYWLDIPPLHTSEHTAWPTTFASYTFQRHMAAGGQLWVLFAPVVPLQDGLSESRW